MREAKREGGARDEREGRGGGGAEETDRQKDRQAGRQTGGRTDRRTKTQNQRKTDIQRPGQIDRD